MKDYTSENPNFSEIIKILESSDPAHADIINQVLKQIFQNTLVLKNSVDAQQSVIDNCPEDVNAKFEELSDAAYAQIITSYADLMANTVGGYLADATAVKEGFVALGGWAIYPEELTQAQYDALPAETRSIPKLIFVIRKG